MVWEVEYTDQFGEWFGGLTEFQQNVIFSTVEHLVRRGPGLGRPLVDSIHGSRHPNMKELRVPFENIRVLFAFDPRRMAILLIGGDKTARWNLWYREMIPVADNLYDEHLETLREEGLL